MKELIFLLLLAPQAPTSQSIDHLPWIDDSQMTSTIRFSSDWFYLPCEGETKMGCFGIRYQPSSDPIGYFTYMKEVSFGELAADFSMNDFHVLTFKVRVPITKYKKLLRPISDY